MPVWNQSPARVQARKLLPILGALVREEQLTGDLTSSMVRAAALEAGCHEKTVRRQLVKYKVNPTVESLVGRRGYPAGQSRLSRQVRDLANDLIQSDFLKQPKPSLSNFTELVHRRLREAFGPDVAVPHRATIKRLIAAIDLRKRLSRRDGRLAAQAARPIHGNHPAVFPSEYWQVDETRTDLLLLTNCRGHILGRAWVTMIIDVVTRVIVGWALDIKGPSTHFLARTLIDAALPKAPIELQDGQLMERPWSGLPLNLQLDRHSSHTQVTVAELKQNLGVNVDYGNAGCPWMRGHVERVIGTLMGMVHAVPGTTMSNIQAKGDYDSEAAAALTIDEFQKWFGIAVEIYNNEIHSNINMPPTAAWQIAARDGTIVGAPVVNAERLKLALYPRSNVTVRRDGVHLNNLVYWHEELCTEIVSGDKKRSVVYDPFDMRRIYLLRPNGDPVELTADGASSTPVDIWTIRAVRRHSLAVGRALENRALLDAAARHLEAIVTLAQSSKTLAKEQTRLGFIHGHRSRAVHEVPFQPPTGPRRATAWNRASQHRLGG